MSDLKHKYAWVEKRLKEAFPDAEIVLEHYDYRNGCCVGILAVNINKSWGIVLEGEVECKETDSGAVQVHPSLFFDLVEGQTWEDFQPIWYRRKSLMEDYPDPAKTLEEWIEGIRPYYKKGYS